MIISNILILVVDRQDSSAVASSVSSAFSVGDWIGIAAIFIPIAGGILFLVFRTGGIVTTVGVMKEGLKKLDDRVDKLSDKFDSLMEKLLTNSNSPRVLNDDGNRILEQSKIAIIVRGFFNRYIDELKDLNPVNAYRAEQALIDIVKNYEYDENTRLAIEDGAFNSGTEPEIVLFVGAISLRDEALHVLGFTPDDIDIDAPSVETS